MAYEPSFSEMTPAKFIAKWAPVRLPERAASQEHFIDLCRLLGQPTPAEHDATGAEYTFEKGVTVTGAASRGSKGDSGYADVWWRGKFGWEYKRKDKYKDLDEAYRQLCQYHEALENPPLLVVSDISRTEIHTKFTGTAKQVHVVLLEDMDKPAALSLLRRVFTDPESFRPTVTPAKVTEDVARNIASLAGLLQARGHDPHSTAHFLMKCMFCLFAEDVNLLPDSLFTRLLGQWHDRPDELSARLGELFDRMRTGGAFGTERIAWFNGGLFDQSPALPLDYGEIGLLRIAAGKDWGSVEPAVFGTLFERSLDPSKRAQIGAHYTSRDDIMLIVEPVVLAPLRAQWDQIKTQAEAQLERRRTAKTAATKKKADEAISKLLADFQHRLASVTILDPACGSGNFLYVALEQLLNIEKEVIAFAARRELGLGGLLPQVRPTQLHGIELNPYAAELAQVVIWIGYLQWMRDNGFVTPDNPILAKLQTIEHRDAILDLSDPARPRPATWPQADFIIGNPPFLGSKLFRQNGLPNDYVAAMYAAYDLPKTSDLCCYWFELARRAIQARPTTRAGLLATQGIRGGDNRTVLERIKQTGDIFMAWADRDWFLDGAAVHVSMVGFDSARQHIRTLDGKPVAAINADLTSGSDVTAASRLPENRSIAFMGDTKVGPFEVDWPAARQMLSWPNPTGKQNIRVVRPWTNGQDITRRSRSMWIVDFPPSTTEAEAAHFEMPYEHILRHVKPMRKTARSGDVTGVPWWIHQRPRPDMRALIEPLPRFLATPNLTKHRLFVWMPGCALPDHQLIAFARSDDYFFGVLHSSVHELWARRMGTQLREVESGFRYTPTTCFETFAFPWPPGQEPAGDALVEAVAAAARELNAQRERWLNPPEWIEPIAGDIDAKDDFADVPEPARPLIRQSAIMSAAAADANLKRRTLTNLYNERPTWLKIAHRKLDEAVLAAYAATDPAGRWSPAWAEAWADTGAGQPLPPEHPQAPRRAEIDQAVLADLLRLNLARSKATE